MNQRSRSFFISITFASFVNCMHVSIKVYSKYPYRFFEVTETTQLMSVILLSILLFSLHSFFQLESFWHSLNTLLCAENFLTAHQADVPLRNYTHSVSHSSIHL